MDPRIQQELATLRDRYGNVDHLEVGGEHWFLLANYRFPPGWQIGDQPLETGPITFPVNGSYPMGEPYGFLTPAGINFKGSPPQNTGSPRQPPFPGEWQFFSWAPEGWSPTADANVGSNLTIWARSFAVRLGEGA